MIFGKVIVRCCYVTAQLLLMLHIVVVVVVMANNGEKTHNVTGTGCKSDSLVMYKVVFQGNWKRDTFPKQFPEYRPPAQFSKTFGRVHNSSYTLFAANVSSEIKSFLDTSRTDKLEKQDQRDAILQTFIIPALHSGEETEEATIFTTSNFSSISLISRLIPSPDWFVGISNLELCQNGEWVEELTVEVELFDAGIDDGLTFTAPRYPTEPQELIARITARQQNHTAGSFYYPEYQELPPMGWIHVQKVAEFCHCNHSQPTTSRTIKSKKRRVVPEMHQKLTTTDLHCQVSDWSPWTPCSKSCGLGQQSRTRTVLVHPTRGSRPCPPLKEKKWCGSGRNCAVNYFKW